MHVHPLKYGMMNAYQVLIHPQMCCCFFLVGLLVYPNFDAYPLLSCTVVSRIQHGTGINTRLWWHKTHIPAGCKLSISAPALELALPPDS